MNLIAFSDSHGHKASIDLPKADLVAFGGDMGCHSEAELIDWLEWFTSLPYKYKVFIAGNHDFALSLEHIEDILKRFNIQKNPNTAKEEGCFYLEDGWVSIEGKTIYGTPWTPTFGNWAYMASEAALELIYKNIPPCDLLITHGPARGILDVNLRGEHCGSVALYKRLLELGPLVKTHVFGHIHPHYDIRHQHSSDGRNYYNIGITDDRLRLLHSPTFVVI